MGLRVPGSYTAKREGTHGCKEEKRDEEEERTFEEEFIFEEELILDQGPLQGRQGDARVQARAAEIRRQEQGEESQAGDRHRAERSPPLWGQGPPQEGRHEEGFAQEMTSMDDRNSRLFLDFSVDKLRQLSSRIESCLGELNDEQVWARGGENENAIGNLVLHLCGNVRQWIGSGVGGRTDTRERDKEFSASGGVAAGELGARLRTAVEEAAAVIAALPPGRLAERIVVQKYDVSVLEAIYHVVEHFSMHTGQIIFATKMLTGSDLDFYRHLRSSAAHGEKIP
jgi:uncharacterized damage-inducible protein DinB